MVSCRWGRDCIEYLHSHSMCVCIRMWRQSSCWILDVHMCMRSLIWHSYLPSHQLSEMQTQVRTHLTCRGAFYSIYITAQLYHTTYYTVVSLTLHWGFFFSFCFYLIYLIFSPHCNGNTTYTHDHTAPRKGGIFHWPLSRQNVIFSQGQQSSAGCLGRESQLKSSNSTHVNTHRCTCTYIHKPQRRG